MGRNLLMGGMQRGGTGEMKMKMKKKRVFSFIATEFTIFSQHSTGE